jgi:hypothetical protein
LLLRYLGWNNHWCWIETGLNLRRIRLHWHLGIAWARVHVRSRLVTLVRHTSSTSTATSAASSPSIIVASSLMLEAYLVILIVILLWNSLTHWALWLRILIRRIRLGSSHLEDATNELVNLLVLFPLLLLLLFFL